MSEYQLSPNGAYSAGFGYIDVVRAICRTRQGQLPARFTF
jgi:hypothetical protein